MVTVRVYYVQEFDGKLWITPERREVAAPAVARGAMEELVSGEPQDPDHRSPYPPAARILGITIEDGLATVDWSAEVLEQDAAGAELEALAIQAAVYTLVGFESIDRVRFSVEGRFEGEASNGRRIEDFWGHVGIGEEPFRQEEHFIVAPIVVFTPLDGASVGSEIRVEGEASTFEANVAFRLFDAAGDRVLVTSTTATEGGPGRGTFQTTIAVPNPPEEPEEWRLEAFESSPEDGRDTFVETRTVIVRAP